MRPIVLAITLFALSLATQQPQMALAQNNQAPPDYDLAYVLATASYCAYAVGDADADGGQQRALQCLNTAADLDGAQLDVFRDIKLENVEAFFNPKAPEDAYLLIQTRTGVILAFRGTLTPPISPSSGRFLSDHNVHEAALFKTFIGDWKNNFSVAPVHDRHSGFDNSWSGLRAHLIAKECAPTDCSKFLSFVSRLHNTASLRLYITGHSKGSALATLAALDLHNLVGGDIVPIVYTFAGAKVLSADGAEQNSQALKDMWRFEHEYDIVPSAPPDRTVIPLLPNAFVYAHVGQRAYFEKGKPPQLSLGPEQGVDKPGDSVRLTAAAVKLLPSGSLSFNPVNLIASIQNLIASIQNLAENNCESLVNNHFLIFSDVQELVHAQHAGAPTTITEENLNGSFFYTGIPDKEGKILWGYSQWCRLLSPASAK